MEGKSATPIMPKAVPIAAPVSALAGVTDADGELLLKAFNIKTVADLGKNKYFASAQALLALKG